MHEDAFNDIRSTCSPTLMLSSARVSVAPWRRSHGRPRLWAVDMHGWSGHAKRFHDFSLSVRMAPHGRMRMRRKSSLFNFYLCSTCMRGWYNCSATCKSITAQNSTQVKSSMRASTDDESSNTRARVLYHEVCWAVHSHRTVSVRRVSGGPCHVALPPGVVARDVAPIPRAQPIRSSPVRQLQTSRALV